MVRCPNCGSTAQPKIADSQHFVWKNEVSIFIKYKCGCGQEFTTREIFERKNEQIINEKA